MLGKLRTAPPLLFAVLVLFVGTVLAVRFGWYDKWSQFDTFMHTLGGLAAAWLGLVLLQHEITHLPFWKQLLIFVSFATLAGVLWELLEYVGDVYQETFPLLHHFLTGGDLTDTLTDLTADIVGALAFSLWALQKERR